MKFYFSQSSRMNQTISEEELRRNALLEDLEKTKQALEVAYMGFDNVTEPDLIDCYIFELNSVLKRYDYIMEQVNKLQPHTEPLPLLDAETPVVVVS